jgi:Fe-Mn family superoxide dismutase
MSEFTRREAITVMVGAAGLLALGEHDPAEGGTSMMDENPTLPPAYRGTHEPKPLPYDAGKLRGLSEKLIR